MTFAPRMSPRRTNAIALRASLAASEKSTQCPWTPSSCIVSSLGRGAFSDVSLRASSSTVLAWYENSSVRPRATRSRSEIPSPWIFTRKVPRRVRAVNVPRTLSRARQ